MNTTNAKKVLRQTKAWDMSLFTINSVYGNLTDQMKPDVCIWSPKLYVGTMGTAFVGMATNYH